MGKYFTTTIQKGSSGDEVKAWQEYLANYGYYTGSIDGIFGDLTEQATRDYQEKVGIGVDGIVGDDTWYAGGFEKKPAGNTNSSSGASLDTTATSKPNVGKAPTVPAMSFLTGSTDRPITDTSTWDESLKGQAALGDYNSAKDKVNNFGDFTYQDYMESDAVKGASDALNAHLANKPGEYQSQWQSQLDALMNSIMNRDKFSYNFNEDALYQQYKDQYIQQGKLAMADTMGQAAAMTGGYGSSYGQSVGQQAYQAQLQNLNDIVPELYQMALNKYNQEGQDLYNQYGMVADRENLDYSRYRDTVSDFLTERDYLQGRYDTERNFDYGKYIDDRNLDYTLHADEYQRLLDSLGIAKDDYYSGADMFASEQATKNNEAWKKYQADEEARKYANSLHQQLYENELREWQLNADQAWKSAEWDEAARQYANEEAWRQKEYDESVRQYNEQMAFQKQQYDEQLKLQQQEADAKYGNSSVVESGNNTTENDTVKYDNGGLTDSQIKELQRAVGANPDGQWGPNSTKAAGGLSAKEAWERYRKGLLGNKSQSVQPTNSANTTQFINRYSDKQRYLQAGHTEKEWNEYMEGNIASFLRDDRITESEALYLIQYYGLS